MDRHCVFYLFPVFDDNDGGDYFLHPWIRTAKDQAVVHTGVGLEDALDLSGGNVVVLVPEIS